MHFAFCTLPATGCSWRGAHGAVHPEPSAGLRHEPAKNNSGKGGAINPKRSF